MISAGRNLKKRNGFYRNEFIRQARAHIPHKDALFGFGLPQAFLKMMSTKRDMNVPRASLRDMGWMLLQRRFLDGCLSRQP
jgi:hypothetical protein